MKKVYFIFLMILSHICLSQVSFSGCYISGALIQQGSTLGCGNGANYCNLASLYVPAFTPTACGTSTASGGVSTSLSTNYSLPAGCTATIIAQYMKRNYFGATVTPSGLGCSNSGMDGSPDALFITNTGGVVIAQSSTIDVNVATCGAYPTLGIYTTATSNLAAGCANADGTVKMILTGGSFNVGGNSNRADEIITFTINMSGTCGPGCSGVLPITLKDFYAEPLENEVLLKWFVATEKNVAYYVLEKSVDGINFTALNTIYSQSKISGENNIAYFNYDYTPVKGINYYRLKNVDKDGDVEMHKTIAVNYKNMLTSAIWVNQTSETIKIGYEALPFSKSVLIRDLSGRIIKEITLKSEAPNENEVYRSEFNSGMYLISGSDPRDGFSQKLLIQ
jgi:hypothetical protein